MVKLQCVSLIFTNTRTHTLSLSFFNVSLSLLDQCFSLQLSISIDKLPIRERRKKELRKTICSKTHNLFHCRVYCHLHQIFGSFRSRKRIEKSVGIWRVGTYSKGQSTLELSEWLWRSKGSILSYHQMKSGFNVFVSDWHLIFSSKKIQWIQEIEIQRVIGCYNSIAVNLWSTLFHSVDLWGSQKKLKMNFVSLLHFLCVVGTFLPFSLILILSYFSLSLSLILSILLFISILIVNSEKLIRWSL
jgi:hypothetical protein